MSFCYLHILILLIVSTNQTTVVTTANICSCTEIRSQSDCLQNSNCEWSENCQSKTPTTVVSTEPYSQLCGSLDTPKSTCPVTYGCAYLNSKCIQFSGCTSYVFTTHDECQSVSNQCTTDGIQCIEPRACVLNTSEGLCSTVISSTGSKKCVWTGTVCRDQICTEGSHGNTTDSDCNSFLAGCVTTGRGCINKRMNCYSYGTDCQGKIGSDGVCVFKELCQPKDCNDADSTYNTDELCQVYRSGCRSYGLGCTEQTLKACNTYKGTLDVCLQYIGKDGKCEGGSNGYCQARKCESASYKSNTECKSYSPICITTGQGCVSKLPLCSTYQGTNAECLFLIGSDGRCKGQYDGISFPCKAKVCTDVNYVTDIDCSNYQIGCLTNGVGCVQKLLNCQSYSGDSDTCNRYIGYDGKCGVGVNGYCALRTCDAGQYITTALCQNVQSNCLSDGIKCVKVTKCTATLKQPSCKDTGNCQWVGQCVANKCSSFNTLGLCQQYASTVDCYWTGSVCADKQCKYASSSLTTDIECQYFHSECITNGQGCIEKSAPCESYVGFIDTCSLYKGVNGTIQCTYDMITAKCRALQCKDNKVAQSADQCNTFLTGCTYNGIKGCLDSTADCTEYKGDSTICYSLNPKCYQFIGITDTCRNILCEDNTTATTDYDCDSFMTGCVTKGQGCISNTASCTSYPGYSISDCEKFTGNGQSCWYDKDYNGQCVDKRCDHNTTATLDLDCEQFLTGCVTTGSGCQSNVLTCDTYNGNEDTCGQFSGNGQRCAKINNCSDRQCSDVESPIKMDDCTNYLSTCIYDGQSACIERAKCNAYSGYSADQCKLLINFDNDYCWQNNTDHLWCGDRNCGDASNITSQNDCNAFRSGCLFDGTDKCVEKSTCQSYQFTSEACMLAVDKNNNGCWYSDNSCRDRTCGDLIASVYSQTVCSEFLGTCIYTGVGCTEQQSDCSQYTLSQDECKFIDCWKETDDDSPCADKTCDDTVSSPSDENCRNHLPSCRFNGLNCVSNQSSCINYIGFTAAACQVVTTSSDVYCWSTTSTVCADRKCTDTLSMYSPNLCASHLQSCRYNGIKCQDAKASCSDYIGFTKDACQQVTTLTKESCWNQGESSICTNSSCNDLIPNASQTACLQHNNLCRYNGYRCIGVQTNCESYDVLSASVCQSLTNSSGNACWNDLSGGTKCITKSCDNKLTSYSTSNCESYIQNLVNGNYIPICSYNGQKCVTMMNACTDYHNFSGIQCQVVRSRTSLCYLESNAIGTCRNRKCADNTTASSDMECDNFLSGCLTTGQGCIESTSSCSSYIGTTSSCANFVGNGINCKGTNSIGQCSTRKCHHNTDFTSSDQCENFLSGCVTNGKGCIAATKPCSSYVGTLQQCQQFKGNGIPCWSDSDEVTACRDRVCSDNTTSITDDQCDQFLTGCVSKGYGCIDVSLPCSSYTGIQAMCKRFKGDNKQTLCWNLSDATSTTKCINRQCSHVARGTNDTECNNFLPGCVTDGQRCVVATTCSQFYGTLHTCALFNATDKPCTGETTVQQCRKLLCSDAPNNYTTDTQCNQFKSGCTTTGFGCTDNSGCSGIKTKGICDLRSDCQFVNGCMDTIKCSGLLNYSQCVNYGCGWNYTKQICRNWQCTDASVLITSHSQCQQLNSQCTTTGNGCIEMQKCSLYSNKQTCINAVSLDYSSRCVWDIDHCRAFICEDALPSLTTDEECQAVHELCVTSGYGCTYKEYQCSNFNSVAKCLSDYLNKPCLWINNTQCVQFGQCTDIHLTTHNECQKYSLSCTSDGVKCIPYSKCSDYPNSESCNIGTDGTCGWVIGYDDQMQKCQIFQACSDIEGITMEDCQYYAETCISDGSRCIEKNTCTNYLTQVACSYNGTDGTCFWDGSVCRLQVCGDAPIIDNMTHDYCYSLPATSKCTTNGKICIAMQYCSNYLQSSCYVGLDGDCTFALPLGQTAGTKTCRVMDCTDYSESSTAACQKHKSTCVSNGAKCISKANCSTYKTQVACESDGLDGICIYENSKCSLLTSCLQAQNNEVACNKKSKGCRFTYVDNNTTNCTAVSCSDNSICQPIFDFSETNVTICVSQKEGECKEGNASLLAQSRCYAYSYYTYTWNTQTNACEKCQKSTTNNTNNTVNNGDMFLFVSFLIWIL